MRFLCKKKLNIHSEIFLFLRLKKIVKKKKPLTDLELSLDLPKLSARQHLYVAAHLFSGARLAGAQLDVARNELVAPVHLALVGEDDLATSTRRVNRKRFL